MNVLLLGSGGREHALAWSLAKSPLLDRLTIAPGNPGMAEIAECVPIALDAHDAIIALARDRAIDLVVVGPEAPLVAGLVDDLAAAGIKAVGPGRQAARLEGSKGFTKDLLREAGVATGAYGCFSDRRAALAYLASVDHRVVVKADGLAAGKGVVIPATAAEAAAAVEACFDGAFGAAGAEVVIEDYLEGEEVSFFALVDGTTAVPFASAQDHKRVGDGDTGPNTGGMGAYSPAPAMTPAMVERTMTEIIGPTVREMARRGTPYHGVLFAGLMITAAGPRLIEYNCRFGDPETQAILLRLASDLLPALLATVDGGIETVSIDWHDDAALAVVMAAEGYPASPRTGSEIRRLSEARQLPGVQIFHAGTRRDGERLLAAGGRVLNIAARGASVAAARDRAYAAVDRIDWPGGFYRRDIGWRALAREQGQDQ